MITSFTLYSSAQGILIRPGTSLVMKGAPTMVVRNGSFINQGNFVAGNSTVSISGHLDSSRTFVNGVSTFYNFEVNKSGNSSILLRSTMNVRSVLSITNGRLVSDSNLVLKSDANLTARVAPLTGTAQITGIARVERYVPAKRAWRLMTAPQTSTKTIFQSWQNNGVYTPGIGTLVTGSSPTGAAGNGLDTSSMNNISLRRWNHATQSFSNISNTHLPISPGSAGSGDNAGYFIFVRGDRNPANTFVPNTNITTLTTTGVLQTGNQSFTAANRIGQFTLVGNPYPSPVNMNLVTRTNLIKRIYVWDPQVNQLGAYVMLDDLDNDGIWTKSLLSSQQTEHVQSTQAFFVETQSNGSASIQFQETYKSSNNNNFVFRPSNTYQSPETTVDNGQALSLTPAIYTNLYLLESNDTKTLADGNLAEFNALFTDSVNLDDAIKLTNQNETIGLFRRGSLLTAERRPPLQVTDTLFYRLSRTSARQYQFEFVPNNIPVGSFQGILEDKFLNTQTPVSLQTPTLVNFSITGNAASAVADRFRLVFKPVYILPVNFIRITATPVQKNIDVQWEVAQELNVAHYVIERSNDGRNFLPIAQVAAQGNRTAHLVYNHQDQVLTAGTYFYRIQSVDADGRTGYSSVAQAKFIGKQQASIQIYPNPITGNQLNIQWQGIADVSAQLVIIAANGQRVSTGNIAINAVNGTTTYRPTLELPTGKYWLELHTANQKVYRQSFLVQ
ncbi:MAG: T9SS type A sorting domain-containing protein [Ferruginibacter sp.]